MKKHKISKRKRLLSIAIIDLTTNLVIALIGSSTNASGLPYLLNPENLGELEI